MNQILELATGTGKTVMAIYLI